MSQPSETRSRLPFGLSWEKVILWMLFGAAVYSLRDFFDIVFMTFIMSYLAQRLVDFLTGARRHGDRWIRKPVIVALYLAALAMVYLSGRFILPLAVDQGKWIITQVQTINLDRIRDEVLAKTLGRIELARYKHSDAYAPALAEFVREKSSLPSFEEFRHTAEAIRQASREQLIVQEGRRAVEELKTSGGFTDLYRTWLLESRAERELERVPELRQRLEAEFDASWMNIYDTERFEQERSTPTYNELRKSRVLRRAADELVEKGAYRDEAEIQVGRRLGEERVAGLSEAEQERRLREYYEKEVPLRWATFPFSHQKFLELEHAADEQDYLQKAGAEERDEAALRRTFDERLELRLAKEHPWTKVIGDTQALVRENVPRITGWLTNAINNVIRFGLNLLLSMMFSLMIVWEVPRMRRSLGRVQGTRAEHLYAEFAPGVSALGSMVGKAFSAQILIAALNAAFAFVAFTWLRLPSPVFLSLLVLFFSLVPYVGIIIAAVPILILALQEGGPQLGLYTAVSMFVIHELEAWIFSPRILGDILHLNPILVIFVLFVGQQLFGIWGLLLAVPVAVFLINDVLLRPPTSRALPLSEGKLVV